MPNANENQQWTQSTRKVPAAALCFNAGVFEFGKSDKPDSKAVPVKLLGRTGKPIAHWYWGNVVHDMAGMQLHKDSLPIDYCHYADEVLGYLDKFDTSTGDLVASGALVPFAEDDRASEVAFKSQNKVPYEASINFGGGPMRLEELEVGASVVVNGNLVNGPALIIRQWTLRGIAICPYGADMNTNTELSRGSAAGGDGKDALASTVEVTLFKATNMSQPNDPTKQTTTEIKPTELQEKPKQDPTPAPAGGTVELQAGMKVEQQPAQPPKPGAEFVSAFGDVGARWFLEGKKFQDAAVEFIGQKNTRITDLEAQVKQLSEQMEAMPRGNDPVTFKSAPKDGDKPLPKGVTGGAAAVFAQAMSKPA